MSGGQTPQSGPVCPVGLWAFTAWSRPLVWKPSASDTCSAIAPGPFVPCLLPLLRADQLHVQFDTITQQQHLMHTLTRQTTTTNPNAHMLYHT